jgi:hypothetical protein
LFEFGVWLKNRGNRISTIERKIRYLKKLCGSLSEMITQVLNKNGVDLSRSKALETVYQYSVLLGCPIEKTKFRVDDNREVFGKIYGFKG